MRLSVAVGAQEEEVDNRRRFSICKEGGAARPEIVHRADAI